MAIIGVLLPFFAPVATATPPRALWVWDSAPLLHDVDARHDFLDFCERHRIGIVWAQILTVGTGADRRVGGGAEWKALLADVHRRGMTLHALDGDPHYAVRAQHDTVLSVVDAVVAFNARTDDTERFDGVHFDIEPYLLPEWGDPRLREPLLADYLDVNQAAAARARAAGLAYGVDIPFWWPETDGLLDIADNVGIMDYRNVASGPDGIIEHAIHTLERADQVSPKTRVFVGVETDVDRGADGVVATERRSKITFAGRSVRDMNAELAASETALATRHSYAGIAIHHYVSFRRLAEGRQ
jgi:hypothetical protein